MPKPIVILAFIVIYVLIIALPKRRCFVALAGALVMLPLSSLSLPAAFCKIDWNVIFMLVGTAGVVSLFIDSKVPDFLSDHIIRRASKVKWAVIFLAAFTGLISAFLENVSTLLIIAPIAIEISRKLKISPVPLIITIAISANLQGAATLVGDPTSIMLGGYADMNFLDFFWFFGRPGIFFAVELGAIASLIVIYFLFRKETQSGRVTAPVKIEDWFPASLILIMIAVLISVSVIQNKPKITNGIICMCTLAVGILREYITGRRERVQKIVSSIDWHTLILLASLFVIIGGFLQTGLLDELAVLLHKVGHGNVFVLFTLVVWGSVFISAFV
ncbi:MAG: arsenic transporter, partial [Lentisphaerae bacterium]|nr:arsenic transporter [Lentisphaerota bacterium]